MPSQGTGLKAGETPITRTVLNGGRGGRVVTIPIASGQTQRITSAGTKFYFVIATAPINARPDNGDFVVYTQGTGLSGSVAFSVVELQNPNVVPLVVQVWIGFDDFIDNRLIIANQTLPSVYFPTSPINPSAGDILIPDLSLTKQTVNGIAYYFLSRQFVLVGNSTSSGATYILQATTAPQDLSGSFPGFPIYPGTSLNLPISGDCSITVGGGPIQAWVGEIYQAVIATA
jgi:hypothetical protein